MLELKYIHYPDLNRVFAGTSMSRTQKLRVLLIDGQDDCLAILIVRCLQRTGNFEVHCLTSAPSHMLRYSIKCKVRFDRFDTPAALLDAVHRYAADHPIDIVIPIQESIIAMAGAVADELNTFTRLAPLPSPDRCDAIDNKWRFHQLLSSTTIKTPRSLLSGGDRTALERELASWDGPYLTKPLYGFGGYGIRKYNSLAELLEALYGNSPSTAEPVLIQDFIPGKDIGCSFISQDGQIIAHTIQRATLAQNRSYTCGLGLEFVHDAAISAIAEEFAWASKWSGVANIDLRVDERNGDIYLLEVNPRYWQTLLGSLAMGINYPEIHCRMALGEHVESCQSRQGNWVNLQALSYDIVNLKRLFVSPQYSWRCVNIRDALGDPLIEALLFWNGFRRYIRAKTESVRRQKQKRGVLSETAAD